MAAERNLLPSSERTDKICLNPLTSRGKLHDQNADFEISNNNHFCVNHLLSVTGSGGGGVLSRNLNITNNFGPVIFRENTTKGSGGAIFSTNCTISNNKQLCSFINNLAYVSDRNGGAINCSSTLKILDNRGPIEFLNNICASRGGAAYAANIDIINNDGEITFRDNKCTKSGSSGGCLHATNITISKNKSPISFTDNQAALAGSILGINVSVTDNFEKISFINNSSFEAGSGGAIYCYAISMTNNRQGIIFAHNNSKSNAGAIMTNTLTLKDNGPVMFLNNSSSSGGAIQNNTTQAIFFYLSADYGDIIFDGNLTINNDTPVKRNAIHSGGDKGGVKLHVGAREGFRAAFYDPIEHEHTTSHVLTFNPESYHLGTVLFSGAHVPQYSTLEQDYCSYLRNTSLINYGVVAVEDKAMLALYKLTQNEGILRLGNRAVIASAGKGATSPSSTGSAIVIQKLALNLPSILQKGAEAPKIWIYPQATGTTPSKTYSEDTNPSITISGDLILLDNDNQDPFDSLDLSGGITKVPFLYLCDNKSNKINIDDLNIEAINDAVHYGYQGIWSPHWETYTTTAGTTLETANTSHRILYADWTPTHYIPNPKYRADIISNALWQSAYNVITGLHTLESSPREASNREIAGGALGAYIAQKTRKAIPGFNLFSKGYSAKAQGSSETKHNFALSFAQFYSQIKELKTKNTVSSNCYFTGAQLQIPWFYDVITTASVGYGYSHNKVKTQDKEQKATSEGKFHGNTLGAELACMLPEGSISNMLFRPFVKALGVRASQESFTETGSNIRFFKVKTPLTNVTLPLGIYCHKENKTLLPTSWEFQFAYTPTVYRKKPKVITLRTVSKGLWLTSGTHVDRHSGSAVIKNTTTFKNMSLGINYRGDFSKSTLCNFLNVTSEIKF